MSIIGITDEIILKLLLKGINHSLEESTYPRTVPTEGYSLQKLLRFNQLNEKIKTFVMLFQKNFTKEQTNNMLSKLATLTIKEEDCNKEAYFKCILGEYSVADNTITINHYKERIESNIEEETLYHELIHMASTRSIKQKYLTGFEIPDYLGISLNEGYTEYITQKYFTKGMGYVYSEDQDLFFAKGIENIIGREKMEELFFNADLEGLIKELSKYTERKNVIKLLYLIDKQHSCIRKYREKRAIINEIAKLNKIKLIEDYKKGLITYEEYQIEYAKNVEGYRNGVLWSEETKVIKDKGIFVLYDQGYSSKVYELKLGSKEKEKEKKYK